MRLCAGLGVLYLTKLNTYLVDHPKLLLTLIWVFFFIAVIPGVIIAVYYPTMGYFKVLAVIIVPAAIALYLRILYGKVRERKRKARMEQKALENAGRHQHKKKR